MSDTKIINKRASRADGSASDAIEQQEPSYRGYPVKEIARRYILHEGEPEEGVRHNFYAKMVDDFRDITDNVPETLFNTLPDLGLSEEERWKICSYHTKSYKGGRTSRPFWSWLKQEGIAPASEAWQSDDGLQELLAEHEERERQRRQAEWEAEDVEEAEDKRRMEQLKKLVPHMPPVFRELCSVCPPEFIHPTVTTLLPLLGTLATRIQARYLDDTMHRTSFHSVIFGPASSGKSFAARLYKMLCRDLERHDAVSMAKTREYMEELQMKKNANEQPHDPHCPFRIQQAITSVPMILRRQQDAMGLHTITFDEEIDTMAKANKGGSYAQKSDLYRKAWDDADYEQEYMSKDTFTGRVQLHMNFLFLGTPQQMMNFYDNPENGLVSRISVAEVHGQEFGEMPVFKPLTARQQAVIDKALARFEQITYAPVEGIDGQWTVQPLVDISDKVAFMLPLLNDWLEKKRLEALEDMDKTKDMFRRRSAVKAFRLAMICTTLYDRMTDRHRKVIADFCLWFADEDCRTLCRLYEVNEATRPVKRFRNYYDLMPDIFTAANLAAVLKEDGRQTPAKQVVYYWKKYGRITKGSNGLYYKKH